MHTNNNNRIEHWAPIIAEYLDDTTELNRLNYFLIFLKAEEQYKK